MHLVSSIYGILQIQNENPLFYMEGNFLLSVRLKIRTHKHKTKKNIISAVWRNIIMKKFYCLQCTRELKIILTILEEPNKLSSTPCNEYLQFLGPPLVIFVAEFFQRKLTLGCFCNVSSNIHATPFTSVNLRQAKNL